MRCCQLDVLKALLIWLVKKYVYFRLNESHFSEWEYFQRNKWMNEWVRESANKRKQWQSWLVCTLKAMSSAYYFRHFKSSKCCRFQDSLFVVYKSFMYNDDDGACDSNERLWQQQKKKKVIEETTEINSNTMHVFELRIFFQLQLWCWLNSNNFRLKNKAKIPSALHIVLKCAEVLFILYYFFFHLVRIRH